MAKPLTQTTGRRPVGASGKGRAEGGMGVKVAGVVAPVRRRTDAPTRRRYDFRCSTSPEGSRRHS